MSGYDDHGQADVAETEARIGAAIEARDTDAAIRAGLADDGLILAGYCPAHREACETYGRDFGPFFGCADCAKPDGYDLQNQYHLAASNREG